MCEGILPLIKPPGKTSFDLVFMLRRLTAIRTIGHAGTLDPFATGVMVLLIGKRFTKLSSLFLNQDKEYLATLHLGVATDTYDIEGLVTARDSRIPTLEELEQALLSFQGTILQTPPMFSAKKIQGKKLYELAREGKVVPRQPVSVTLHCEIKSYTYPELVLNVSCSKGTYIRSLAHDLGALLGCGAHLSKLVRTRSGSVTLSDCCEGARLMQPDYDWKFFLKQEVPHVPHYTAL